MATGRTEIQRVTIPAAGEFDGDVELIRPGFVSLRIGTIWVRIDSRAAAETVASEWRLAAKELWRIATDASADRFTDDLGVGPVSVLIKIGPDVVTRAEPMAIRGQRPYLRFRVGPVVWVVLDQPAYWSMRRLWDEVEASFG